MISCIFRKISSFSPVCIDYSSLVSSKSLSSEISEAYGDKGLGILIIKNVPGFQEKRQKLLPLARTLALLPQSSKAPLEMEQYKYSVGWSHGKENFGGQPDYSKGSFYANPQVDSPPPGDDWPPNVWPQKSLPELETAFKSLGEEIIKIGALLARHIDFFVSSKVKSYEKNTLENIILTHKSHVGRLLHYFPQHGDSQNWCGWHNDHGALTGLTTSMYLDQKTGKLVATDELNTENTGLFVRNRKSEILKAKSGADQVIFQIGETAQILSGGLLQATPHAVFNNGNLGDVSRNTFAVFMEPRGSYVLNSENEEGVFVEHQDVPSLKKRWKNGMSFKQFHLNTIGTFQ